MSDRRRHLSGQLSRLVAGNVRRLIDEKGLQSADVIDRAGFKPNYYYVRMRLEIGFSLADLEVLADALDVVPNVLLQDLPGHHSALRMDGSELARRLRLLLRTYGHGAGIQDLVTAVEGSVSDFSSQTWETLTAGDDLVTVDPDVLAAIASFFEVEPAYLTEPAIDEAVERVKAELELQDALQAAGATTVAARSLGEASPSVLRAIAAALRARPAD